MANPFNCACSLSCEPGFDYIIALCRSKSRQGWMLPSFRTFSLREKTNTTLWNQSYENGKDAC